jgi:predicted transcriptional regulator
LKNRGKGIADEDRNRYLISAGVIKNRMLTTAGIYDKQILQPAVSPMKSSEISWLTGLSKPTVLQHLKKLKELDLIKKTGSGAQTKYEIFR